MIYSIGHNIAGYMPETEAEWFADREEAVKRLIDVMREYASSDDYATWEALPGDEETARAHGYTVTDEGIDYGDDWPAMGASVDSVLTDDGPDTLAEGPWSARVESGRGHMIAFWLHAEDFDSEYAATRDGVRVEVEKIGGGTVGQKYAGTWRYVARYADGELIACGNDFYCPTPITHHGAVARILDHLDTDA